jgi:hypothetical protein
MVMKQEQIAVGSVTLDLAVPDRCGPVRLFFPVPHDSVDPSLAEKPVFVRLQSKGGIRYCILFTLLK